jgi:DNA polymerase I
MLARPLLRFIDTPTKARAHRDELHKMGRVELAVDTEYDEVAHGDHEPVLMSYSWARGVRRVILADLAKKYFADYLSDPKSRLVYQNYKADHLTFAKLGIDTRASFFTDIMVTSWLCDETLLQHGLKEQSWNWLRWRRKHYQDIFFYVPDGKRQPIRLRPSEILSGDLPAEALELHSAAEWLQLFLEYSGDDAESTYSNHVHHKRYLESIGYWPVYLKVDRPYTLTLLNMEDRGVSLDVPILRGILRKVDVTLLRAQHAFRAAIGQSDFNLRSNRQLQALCFGELGLGWPTRDDLRTATGNPKLDEEALRWYVEEHGFDLAQLKLNHSKAATLKGTFLTGLINGVSSDGRLRSDFNQIGAKSGRISSRKRMEEREVTYTTPVLKVEKTVIKKVRVGANQQNIPVRKEKDPYGIRRAFRAPCIGEIDAFGEVVTEEMELTVGDISGAELLMAIHWASKLEPDSPMLAIMKKYGSPSAIHANTAIRMEGHIRDALTGLKLGDVDLADWRKVKPTFPDQYLLAKNLNFGLLYGAMAKRIAILLRLDYRDPRVLRRIQKQIDLWNRIYPEMAVYQRWAIKHGYKHGWVPTISGRRGNVSIYLESDDRSIRSYGERLCTNICCQASIADIIKVAMNLIDNDEELRDLHAVLLNQVHDELIVENPKRHSPRVRERMAELMARPYARLFDFKLDIEVASGPTWMSAKA